jgi:glycogen operon protein
LTGGVFFIVDFPLVELFGVGEISHREVAHDPSIENLRERQIKNYFAYTLLSMGTPMIQMGDEVRRTQQGNNNAYCQDNPTSWFDWDLVGEHASLLHFVRELIRFRLHHFVIPDSEERPLWQVLEELKISWHGVRLNQPDWSEGSRSLAATVVSSNGVDHAHLIFNTYWEALDFELPLLPAGITWKRVLDTNLAPPEDIRDVHQAQPVQGFTYRAAPRSVVVLIAAVPG